MCAYVAMNKLYIMCMAYKARQHEHKGNYSEHWNSVVNSLRGKGFIVLKFLSTHNNRVLLLMYQLSQGWPVQRAS